MNQLPLTLQSRRAWLRHALAGAFAGGLALGAPLSARGEDGPNSSLFSGKMRPVSRQLQPGMAGPMFSQPGAPQAGFAQPSASPATSWYETPLPPPKEARVNDIITIRVDLGTRMSADAQWQRRRNGRYDAILNDWVILNGLRSVKPAPQSDGDQRIQGNLNLLDRAQGDLETSESLKFEIAATVAAVLPNGNLVLEAHRTIRNNHDYWLHSLTGTCRREDIGPGNIILSKDIANLQIEKKELGQVRDSYKRGWLTRLWDEFTPF
ncbi:MAG: flagellar basal body L-ring protein FlgH [Pirellulaceae bacterium]|nr:flagellar basal body L-ring protein FlgH [Pirellulaceae bacterium]